MASIIGLQYYNEAIKYSLAVLKGTVTTNEVLLIKDGCYLTQVSLYQGWNLL